MGRSCVLRTINRGLGDARRDRHVDIDLAATHTAEPWKCGAPDVKLRPARQPGRFFDKRNGRRWSRQAGFGALDGLIGRWLGASAHQCPAFHPESELLQLLGRELLRCRRAAAAATAARFLVLLGEEPLVGGELALVGGKLAPSAAEWRVLRWLPSSSGPRSPRHSPPIPPGPVKSTDNLYYDSTNRSDQSAQVRGSCDRLAARPYTAPHFPEGRRRRRRVARPAGAHRRRVGSLPGHVDLQARGDQRFSERWTIGRRRRATARGHRREARAESFGAESVGGERALAGERKGQVADLGHGDHPIKHRGGRVRVGLVPVAGQQQALCQGSRRRRLATGDAVKLPHPAPRLPW